MKCRHLILYLEMLFVSNKGSTCQQTSDSYGPNSVKLMNQR